MGKYEFRKEKASAGWPGVVSTFFIFRKIERMKRKTDFIRSMTPGSAWGFYDFTKKEKYILYGGNYISTIEKENDI